MKKEEAIKELRGFIGQLTEGCQEAIKVLIPELKESKDERIRKAIVALIGELQQSDKNFAGVELTDMLAWLEKQKPLEWSEDIIRKGIKEVGLTQYQINWLKNNVFPPKEEQKPVDLEKEIRKHTDLFQADIEYPLRLTAIKFYELGRKGGSK